MRRIESRILLMLTAMLFFYLGIFYAEHPGTKWTMDYSEALRFAVSRMESDARNALHAALRAYEMCKIILREIAARAVS